MLVEGVTEQADAAQFAHRSPQRVQRYLLPKLAAMIFVIDGVLDGGVNDSLSFASGSSSSRMAGELLQQIAGIELLHVPYKSNTLAITDVIGGQVNVVIPDTATGLPQVRSGKLRALGTTGSKRAPQAPEVPTIAEAAVPGYEMGYWFAAYAPANTPAPVVKRLHELLAKAVDSPQARGFYDNSGVGLATSTPEELAKFQVAESQKWRRIIRAVKIEPE